VCVLLVIISTIWKAKLNGRSSIRLGTSVKSSPTRSRSRRRLAWPQGRQRVAVCRGGRCLL
jgi:hypothetical protein